MAETVQGVKKVAVLYRVSTKAQVDKITDDIPMQQNACRGFLAGKPGWVLAQEYYEKGVSGYKKKATQRDVLQQLKADGEKGLFDVLLVFMVDRLGRREDETPFIMQWFSRQGIEIWSVKEGRQYADSRTDLLLNFIKSWQSSGESEKTGIRVREKQSQMGKEGKFTGGNAPFGYDLIYSGEESRTGRRLRKLLVNEEERDIVQKMYALNVYHGYGGRRLALYLNEKGVKTKKGGVWNATSVNQLLRNPLYKGYPAYGKTTQVTGKTKRTAMDEWYAPAHKVGELAIIGEDLWEKSQKLRRGRAEAYQGKSVPNGPLMTKGALLLTGVVYCGHCGGRLSQHNSITRWTTRNEGTKKACCKMYKCARKGGGHPCEGKTTYGKTIIERPVAAAVDAYMARLEIIDLAKRASEVTRRYAKAKTDVLKYKQNKFAQNVKELEKLHLEIGRALEGQSKFSPRMISSAIEALEKDTAQIEADISDLMEKIQKTYENHARKDLQNLTPCWKAEFETAPMEVKKMLISELLEKVVVFRDKIEVVFKITYNDFMGYGENPPPAIKS